MHYERGLRYSHVVAQLPVVMQYGVLQIDHVGSASFCIDAALSEMRVKADDVGGPVDGLERSAHLTPAKHVEAHVQRLGVADCVVSVLKTMKESENQETMLPDDDVAVMQ